MLVGMIIFSSRLFKKSLNQNWKLVQSMQVSTWYPKIVFHLLLICLQALVAIDWIMPEIVAVLFNLWLGCWFRSTALHRIQFATCWKVPITYFYSQTNEWLNDWANRWVLLVESSCKFQWKSISNIVTGHMFVLAVQTTCSVQELGHWFCIQNLWLSSGIAWRSDCQMTGRGWNLDSNLTYAAWWPWHTSCNGFICSQTPE